jgi:predicted RNA-binding protein with PUA domain
MTVAELIAKLQEMPQDARVVLENRYDGFDDADEVKAVPIVVGLRFNEGIGGQHGEWGSYLKEPPDATAVCIG